MVGIGGYNLRDTYLSPSTDINYTGWVAWVLNERMKIVRLADYNVSRQQLINVEFGSTRNGAETANEYAGFVDYSLGYHYRFPQVLSGLKVLTGASARLSGGFIYNTRNSNNPVSGKADFDLNLSAMAIIHHRHLIAIAVPGDGPVVSGQISLRITGEEAHAAGAGVFQIGV